MARPLRRLILWLIAVPLVLALLGVAALWWFLDPERLRARLQAEASAMLERPVHLDGPLQWKYGPTLTIRSGPGSIDNAPGFGAEPFARWRQIELGLALWPLLRREVRIDRIHVEGLRLDVQVQQDGHGNWPMPDVESAPPDAPESTTLLRIGRIALDDAAIRYRDIPAATTWQLQELSFAVDLPGELDATALEFGDLRLDGRLDGGPIAQGGVPVAFAAPTLQLALPRIALQTFTLRWAEARVAGDVELSLGDEPSAQGRLRAEAPSLRELLATVGVQPPAMQDPSTLGRFELQATLAHAQGRTEVQDVALELDDTRAGGWVVVDALSPLAMRFELDADRAELDRYLAPAADGDEPFELPLAQLRELDVKGVLTIGEATLAGAAAKQVRIDVE